MKTFQEQQPGFDPETMCKYSGKPMRKVPARYCCGRLFLWHVREFDGTNIGTSLIEGDALLWAEANPVQLQQAIDAGSAWIKQARKLKYKNP